MLRTFSAHQRPRILFTSFIDLYALPDDFPGVADHTRNSDDPRRYAEALEKALAEDIPDRRFIPHLQLHEFETLLFADPTALKIAYTGIDNAVDELERMIIDAGDIEKINDGPQSAPSKRIIRLIPGYSSDKTTVGPDVTEHIGMQKLMNASHHFRDWINLITHRLAEL
jgi:hypothetical protein